jgi:hypothetical protein
MVGTNATVPPAVLKVAGLEESILVTSQAPLVDITSSQVAGNIDRRQMEALPLQGRNWQELSLLIKGITVNNVAERPGVARDDQFQLNLDGQQITQRVAGSGFGQPKVSRDAIAEFQIVTNLFDITQGRSNGIQDDAMLTSSVRAQPGLAGGAAGGQKRRPHQAVRLRRRPSRVSAAQRRASRRPRAVDGAAHSGPVHDAMMRDLAAASIDTISLLPAFRATGLPTMGFRDQSGKTIDPHWNADGHRVAARAIAQALAPRLPGGAGAQPFLDEEEIQAAVMKAGIDALYTRGDAAAAETEFRKVLERNPTHYGATYQLATALDRAGKPVEARALWEVVVTMAEKYKRPDDAHHGAHAAGAHALTCTRAFAHSSALPSLARPAHRHDQ